MLNTATEAWESTHTAGEVVDWLRALPSVLILTHVRPDGDAIGSSIALARALDLRAGERGRRPATGVLAVADVCYAGAMPAWAGQMIGTTKYRVADESAVFGPALDPGGIVVVDTGAWTQLRPFAEWLGPRHDKAAVIDHHLSGDPEVAARRLIRTDAAAACQIVADVVCRLLDADSPAKLPQSIAEPLYLGLCTDTGWFKHGNVSPAVLRLAADLLETGVRPGLLYETVEQQDQPSRLRLLRRALETMELHDHDRIAVMALGTDDFREAKAVPGETGGFHDIVRTVGTVRVTVLLTEMTSSDGVWTKVSLRSRGGEHMVDVNRVAGRLGGGGHAQAAGAKIAAPLAEARARVLEVVREAMA